MTPPRLSKASRTNCQVMTLVVKLQFWTKTSQEQLDLATLTLEYQKEHTMLRLKLSVLTEVMEPLVA